MDNETIDLSRPEHIRLRYDGAAIVEADSIDELFAGGETPLYYMLEENETTTMAVYIPKFSEHEIIIDLVPEGEENNSEAEENSLETEENAFDAGENTLETEKNISEYGEKETEDRETKTKNESTVPAKSTPAFEFGLAAAGLTIAHGFKQRQ
jgi:hypothetical protein